MENVQLPQGGTGQMSDDGFPHRKITGRLGKYPPVCQMYMPEHTVFCQMNAPGAEAENEPLTLSDLNETNCEAS